MDPNSGRIEFPKDRQEALLKGLVPVPRAHRAAALLAAVAGASMFESPNRAARRWANANSSRTRTESKRRKRNRRRNKAARIARRAQR